MVRSGLARDPETGRLGTAHHVDAARRRQVLEVDPGAREPGEGDVTHDHELLGLGRLARHAHSA